MDLLVHQRYGRLTQTKLGFKVTTTSTLMRQKLILAVIVILSTSPVGAQNEPANAIFWKELQALCGKAFAGEVAAAPVDDTTFKDKALVMHVRSCENDRIRIPFSVGEDRS